MSQVLKKRKIGKRTKRFTGCWTCRRRGVSCDERKPQCVKCVNGKFTCEGYDVRLCWGNQGVSNKPKFDSTRSFILYEWDEHLLLDQLQLDYYLEKIDIASNFISEKNVEPESDFKYGPFQVFSCGAPEKAHKPGKQVVEVCVVEDIQNSTEQTPVPNTGVRPNMTSFLLERLKSMNFLTVTDSPGAELLLLEFWYSHLAKLFVPTMDESFNPYIMLADEALNGESLAVEIRQTVLHSICVVTASWLSVPGHISTLDSYFEDVMFEEYMKYHKSRSFDLVTITYTWKEAFSLEELGMLVASILLLLTLDVFHPSNQWQVHLKGLLLILRPVVKKFKTNTNSSLVTNESELSDIMVFFAKMSKLSYIFSSPTQDCDTSNAFSLSILDFDFISFPNEVDTCSLLYKNYGITDKMFSCVTSLFTYLQFNEDSQECDINIADIEEMLEECQPEGLPLDDDISTKLDAQIRYHQSIIFYIAVKLYFLKEVKSEKPRNYQHLVNMGIRHIEESLKLAENLDSVGFFWPYFVICCEALTFKGQERLEKWFETATIYNVANVEKGIEIIRKVWEERLMDENLSWVTIKAAMYPTLLLS